MSSPHIPSLHAIGSRLRFRQLRLLIAVDELGSLHRVADHLGMTQPGASKALAEIESTFGAELFTRHPHGLTANELGRCAIRYSRLISTDLDHLREEMAGILDGRGGRLAIGAISGAVPTVLVQAVMRLREKQPLVSIEIIEDTSAQLLQAVAAGRLDLAICRTTVAAQPELFDFEWLCDEFASVAVGPRHPLADAHTVTLQDLAPYRWILYPSNMPLRTLLQRELREAGIDMPSHAIETASTFTSVLLLQEDAGLVALFSAETAAFFHQHGMARRLPLEIRARTEPFGIVSRRGAPMSPVARMMVEELRQEGAARSAAQAARVAPDLGATL